MKDLRAALLSLAVFAIAMVGCTRDVAAGLDEAEANRGVVALARVGLEAEKSPDPTNEGKFKLVVGRDDATNAIAVLAGEEIPRARVAAAKEPGLVASPETERAARITASAQQIERTLASIDGVLDARVHLDVPQIDPLTTALAGPDTKLQHATASVLIRHRGANPPIAIDEVKRLVAGASAGLTPDAVAVVTVSVALPASSGDRQLSYVGPIAITRGSLPTFRAIAASALGLVALLAAALIVTAMRLRRAKDALDDAATRAAPRPAEGAR